MRLFISLDLPSEIADIIQKIQKEISQKNFVVGKPTKKENLHLTLKFLGEVDENKIDEIKKLLSEIKFPKFEIHLGKLGFFGERVFWVELLGDGVFQLQKIIDEKLSDLFPAEQRFMSHITILRISKIKNKKEILGSVKKLNYIQESFQIKSFSLKKSVLSIGGSEYESLLTVDLK